MVIFFFLFKNIIHSASCRAVVVVLCRTNMTEAEYLFAHLEHFADGDRFAFAAEREAAELREELERLHACHIGAEYLEAAYGDLVLFDEARSALKVLLAGLLVHHADDDFELHLHCGRVYVHNRVEARTNDRRTLQYDHLSVKYFSNVAHVLQVA